MWAAKHRAGRRFSTEHVWTFQLFQHFVDMGKYELNMVYKFDLTRNLNGQPLQFMVKDRCACSFHMGMSSRIMPVMVCRGILCPDGWTCDVAAKPGDRGARSNLQEDLHWPCIALRCAISTPCCLPVEVEGSL